MPRIFEICHPVTRASRAKAHAATKETEGRLGQWELHYGRPERAEPPGRETSTASSDSKHCQCCAS
jgi:hypothetical protein